MMIPPTTSVATSVCVPVIVARASLESFETKSAGRGAASRFSVEATEKQRLRPRAGALGCAARWGPDRLSLRVRGRLPDCPRPVARWPEARRPITRGPPPDCPTPDARRPIARGPIARLPAVRRPLPDGPLAEARAADAMDALDHIAATPWLMVRRPRERAGTATPIAAHAGARPHPATSRAPFQYRADHLPAGPTRVTKDASADFVRCTT